MFIDSVANITITKVFSANRLINSPVGITTYRHNRNGWAVVLKFEGETIYYANGQTVLSNINHPVILPKGCSYSWKCTKGGECIIIEFEADSTCPDIFSFNVNGTSLIINNFTKIEKSLNSRKPYHKAECYHLLYEIISFLIKSKEKEYIDSKTLNLITPAIKYILENYFDSNITNDFLAELCGISTVYFRKKFESIYGVSPIKYLHNFRIKKAKAILLSDYESIEQVGLSVGYNSIYHFSKMFKIYTGISPSEYAKASRN